LPRHADPAPTDSCMNGPNMAAAITKQITTIDENDVPHLEVEILTVTASPFQPTAPEFGPSDYGAGTITYTSSPSR
jgi:hypothetical protein